MQYEHIDDHDQLVDFCSAAQDEPFLGFDTEFVSEDTYRPQLCLVQVTAGERLAVIDPLSIDDVTPFWELLASKGHQTIVHAGREEFRFCLQATGRRPSECRSSMTPVKTRRPARSGSRCASEGRVNGDR